MPEPKYLTQHQTENGSRWAIDGQYLPSGSLADLLGEPLAIMLHTLSAAETEGAADGALLSPLEAEHEVWASGVTYLRSRDARQSESTVADVYGLVYEAERPELFFKANGRRVVGHEGVVRIRQDSAWNVPEPEIGLVINSNLEIVGYTAGNDMSSRSIEGENPLYLPQAKIYDDSCALGPGIILASADKIRALAVGITITRAGEPVFQGATGASQMKRRFEDLVAYLGRALAFPQGVFLMTGTGIVPPDTFTLQPDDIVSITVGELTLVNEVQFTRDRTA